ncbi:hypothetical protein [Magnetospirillum sp. SS-4]|uniref:hypothetical protein n=1 Tax=Magnetospirillum sp. SS-4 TaxID=2681465 RepID=UPI0013824F05|nr:hypothetical protein [Magnetospirillum sp. SS-4]CAA7627596.1 conserved hypothetical protein [Magnetospirillum sp. SS-4]
MKPSSGLRFEHARLMCRDALAAGQSKPALCQIARVVDNIVWYEVLGADGAIVSREWCDAARFPDIFAKAA